MPAHQVTQAYHQWKIWTGTSKTHTMKPIILNQSWLVLRVRVCVHTRLRWSEISSHSQKCFCIPIITLGNSLTLCSFHSNWFFNSFPQLKIVLNEHLGYIHQVGFHPEILSMIDRKDKDEKQIQNTVTNHYWRHKLWTGNISFPTCQVTLDSDEIILLVSRKTQKANVVNIIAVFHTLKLFNCKSMFL